MFKHQLRTAFHLLKPNTYHQIQDYKANMEQGTKVMSPLHQFKVDDCVLVQNFGAGEWWIEGIIIRQLGSVNYEMGVGGGLVRQHVNQLVRLPLKIMVKVVPNMPVVEVHELPEVPQTLEVSGVSTDSPANDAMISPGYTEMPNATEIPEDRQSG